MNTKYIDARICHISGMGGAFTPPNHPTQTKSIEIDLKRKKENRGAMSLEYALEQDYVSPGLKAKISKLLNDWDAAKLPISDHSVISWISDTIKHMGAEKGAPYIRKYYPEYTLTL